MGYKSVALQYRGGRTLLSFWHEKIGSMPLLNGVSLPISATLDEATQSLSKDPDAIAIAVVDGQRFVGSASATSVLSALQQLGPHERLNKVSLDCDTVCTSNNSVSEAFERLVKSSQAALAVTDDGVFKGFLSSKELLRHVAISNLKPRAGLATDVSAAANQFVSYVAHDLRNPLSVIFMAGDMLEHAAESNPQTRKYRDLIRRASMQALQISDGLVQMERYTQTNKIFPQQVSLRELVEEIYAENNELVQYKGRKLVVDFGEDHLVNLDSYLVKRAVLNLIDNACKHSRPKGRVCISATRICNADTDVVEFSVRDEGRGISKQNTQKIFEPFVQIKNDEQTLGYGLGLTIAKRFSQLHGGSIRAESTEGRGTTFTLSIPAV